MKRSRLLLLGCGALALPVALVAAWLAIALFPGFGGMDSSHHPFRSERAKERYLRLYDARAERWPVAQETRTVETSFGPTFVRISGPADGPPLVLLHGAGGSSLQWAPNVAALSEGHRTYAVDGLYGYGRSAYRRRLESAGDFVSWLDELVDWLGGLGPGRSTEPIRLVGLSYGGWQAAQYALHHPERLDALVLVAPAGTVQPLSGEWIRRAVLLAVPLRRFTENFFHWLMADWAARGTVGGLRLEDEVDLVYRGIRSFKMNRLVPPGSLTDARLRSLQQVPTLFLVGENEKIYSPERAVERLHEIAPRIETLIVPDAGHDLTVVRADRVNAAILEFLEEPPV